MEIKTLKDLRFFDYDSLDGMSGGNIKRQIKQLAIRWLKSNSPYLNDCNDAVAIWIKHFFNIEDGDIKENNDEIK